MLAKGLAYIVIMASSVAFAQDTKPPDPPPPPNPGEPAITLSLAFASRTDRTVGGGVVSGSGVLTPDEFSGVVRYTLTLPVPHLRGYEPPAPQLWYSSRAGNEKAGVGWSFEFGAIHRSDFKRAGVQEFSHRSPVSSSPLVRGPTGKYTAEVNPPYSQYEVTGDGWMMTDQSGVRFRFGMNGSHRIPKDASHHATKQWLLEEIEDPHGNVVSFDYDIASNIAYPTRARYGAYRGVAGAEMPHVVEYVFTYEARPDVAAYSSSGVRYVVDKRLGKC